MTEIFDFIGTDELGSILGHGEGSQLVDAGGSAAWLAGPEVGIPVDAALAIRKMLPAELEKVEEAPGFFPWLAHSAGITAKENYEGLPAALGLAYYYLWPPIRSLWTLEQQFSGVLDQGYRWLKASADALSAPTSAAGNAESSVEGGAKVLDAALAEAAKIFTDTTGWL